jgi:phospholipase C
MRNQALWQTTAIFVSWDDWGGFYDHVVPEKPYTSVPSPDTRDTTYGIRVPGLLISPWVTKRGYIDPQTLSHDAYLKLIEDIFLQSERIGGSGSPTAVDDRVAHRESADNVGDLVKELDFGHEPLAPLTNLSCNP